MSDCGLPKRFTESWLAHEGVKDVRIREISQKNLRTLIDLVSKWPLMPNATLGYKFAETTRGGVDTRDLNSKTMESNIRPQLFFVGEVVDVAGWLGGYNLQWAWSSGYVAGMNA